MTSNLSGQSRKVTRPYGEVVRVMADPLYSSGRDSSPLPPPFISSGPGWLTQLIDCWHAWRERRLARQLGQVSR